MTLTLRGPHRLSVCLKILLCSYFIFTDMNQRIATNIRLLSGTAELVRPGLCCSSVLSFNLSHITFRWCLYRIPVIDVVSHNSLMTLNTFSRTPGEWKSKMGFIVLKHQGRTHMTEVRGPRENIFLSPSGLESPSIPWFMTSWLHPYWAFLRLL